MRAAYDWLTDAVQARLGREPDQVIARDVAVTGARIGQVRRALGIPPCRVDKMQRTTSVTFAITHALKAWIDDQRGDLSRRAWLEAVCVGQGFDPHADVER